MYISGDTSFHIILIHTATPPLCRRCLQGSGFLGRSLVAASSSPWAWLITTGVLFPENCASNKVRLLDDCFDFQISISDFAAVFQSKYLGHRTPHRPLTGGDDEKPSGTTSTCSSSLGLGLSRLHGCANSKFTYGCYLKWWFPPKHTKMISFSRKSNSYWVPLFKGTPYRKYHK